MLHQRRGSKRSEPRQIRNHCVHNFSEIENFGETLFDFLTLIPVGSQLFGFFFLINSPRPRRRVPKIGEHGKMEYALRKCVYKKTL
jgi:hypothetical protein